jgi:hypothetical protein
MDGSGAVIAATVLTIGEVWASASALGPSVFTIRSPFFHEQKNKGGNIGSIRFAEGGVVVLGVMVGGAVSYMSHSPLPMIGAGIAIIGQVAAWEWAMRNPVGDDVDEALPDLSAPIRGGALW